MKNHFVLKSEDGKLPTVFEVFKNEKIADAHLEFADFIIENMQNLGFCYYSKPDTKIKFVGIGFYKQKEFIPWEIGMLTITYGSETLSFQHKFNEYV